MKKGNQQERRGREETGSSTCRRWSWSRSVGLWPGPIPLPAIPNFPLSLHSFNSFLILNEWSHKGTTRFIFVKTMFFFFTKLNVGWTFKELLVPEKYKSSQRPSSALPLGEPRTSASLPHLSSRFCCSAHFSAHSHPSRSFILTHGPTDNRSHSQNLERVPHCLQNKVLELFASPPLHGAYTSASLPGSAVSQDCTAPFYVEVFCSPPSHCLESHSSALCMTSTQAKFHKWLSLNPSTPLWTSVHIVIIAHQRSPSVSGSCPLQTGSSLKNSLFWFLFTSPSHLSWLLPHKYFSNI